MTLAQIIILWIVVIFLGFYCSYLMWKLQELTKRVNKLQYKLRMIDDRTCFIAKNLNELRKDYIKEEGSNENNR